VAWVGSPCSVAAPCDGRGSRRELGHGVGKGAERECVRKRE
jgi:hypothetical protein